MKVLGIETSCDETAAAVVEFVDPDRRILLSNVVASSMDLHKAFGGVVPEIAARSHIESINPVIQQALEDAETDWNDIDSIAVTYGPGLGGSLLVGVLTARTLAITKNKPLYAVNHVMAHPFACFINETSSKFKDQSSKIKLPDRQPEFPMLTLIVSGGHSQLVLFKSPFDYKLLGQTRDDAVGEAFDKVAKILGLPYPGGPSISQSAEKGDPLAYQLPISQMDNPYDFSFSGLKTAVLRVLQKECGKSHDFPSNKLSGLLDEPTVANMSAGFQYTAVKTLVDKTQKAIEEFKPTSVVVSGGVSANLELRKQMDEQLHVKPIYADIKLCTDNGAMIAVLGGYMAKFNQKPADPHLLDVVPSLSM